jgi:hypothetical protein
VWGTQPLWTVVLRAIKEKDNRNKTKVKSIKGYENDRRSFIVRLKLGFDGSKLVY